jgi:hypothetical protein
MPHNHKSIRKSEFYNNITQKCHCGYTFTVTNKNEKGLSLQMKLHMKKCPIDWEENKPELITNRTVNYIDTA